MRIGMGVSYKQPCKNGYCWMCAEKGYVQGNGAAQTNPVAMRPTLGYAPIWENIIRASEESS